MLRFLLFSDLYNVIWARWGSSHLTDAILNLLHRIISDSGLISLRWIKAYHLRASIWNRTRVAATVATYASDLAWLRRNGIARRWRNSRSRERLSLLLLQPLHLVRAHCSNGVRRRTFLHHPLHSIHVPLVLRHSLIAFLLVLHQLICNLLLNLLLLSSVGALSLYWLIWLAQDWASNLLQLVTTFPQVS